MAYQGEWLRIVGLGTESAFGVPTTVKAWVNRSDAKFDLEIPLEDVPQVVGVRELKKTYQKSRMIDPTLGFDIEPENGIGLILKTGFGTINTTNNSSAAGGTAYLHDFSLNQAAEVPQTLFAAVPQIGTNTKNYTGLYPTKISFDLGKDENAKCSVTFLGKNEATGTYAQGTFSALSPFNTFSNLSVQIDGTASTDITNLKFDLDFGGKKIMALGTNNTISKVVAGAVKVEGSFDIYFQDETERTKFTAKTASSLKVQMTGAAIVGTALHTLTVGIPKIEYASAEFKNEDGVTGATVAFRGQYGSNAVGTGVVVASLQNSVSVY